MSRRSKGAGSGSGPAGPEVKSGPATPAYEVGFRRPPVHTRFPPGTSGNPKGRPRRSDHPDHELLRRPAQKILREELYRSVKIREGGEEIEVSALQAVARAAVVTAVKGSSHAQKTLLQFGHQLEEDAIRRREQTLKWALEMKWSAEATLAYCKKLGLPEELVPIHPDDILVDTATGDVDIIGPVTAEQRAVLEEAVARRDEAQTMMLKAIELLRDQPDDLILQGIRWIAQGRFDAINDALPSRFKKELEGRLPPGATPPKLTGRKPRRPSN